MIAVTKSRTRKMPQTEWRCEERVPIDFTFSFKRFDKTGGLAYAVDLSAGGIRFQQIGFDIKDDEALLVQFTIGRRTFSFCGRSVRMVPLGDCAQEVALSFAGVDSRARKRLRKYLLGSPCQNVQ
jgi:hypothetical protein